MRHLNTTELQSTYAGGAVLSISLLSNGDDVEVRIVTASGDSVLVADGDAKIKSSLAGLRNGPTVYSL